MEFNNYGINHLFLFLSALCLVGGVFTGLSRWLKPSISQKVNSKKESSLINLFLATTICFCIGCIIVILPDKNAINTTNFQVIPAGFHFALPLENFETVKTKIEILESVKVRKKGRITHTVYYNLSADEVYSCYLNERKATSLLSKLHAALRKSIEVEAKFHKELNDYFYTEVDKRFKTLISENNFVANSPPHGGGLFRNQKTLTSSFI